MSGQSSTDVLSKVCADNLLFGTKSNFQQRCQIWILRKSFCFHDFDWLCPVFQNFHFLYWLSSYFGSLNHQNSFHIRDPAQKDYLCCRFWDLSNFEPYPTLNDYWHCYHFGCWVGRDTALTRLPNTLLLLWVKTHHITSKLVMKQLRHAQPLSDGKIPLRINDHASLWKSPEIRCIKWSFEVLCNALCFYFIHAIGRWNWLSDVMMQWHG